MIFEPSLGSKICYLNQGFGSNLKHPILEPEPKKNIEPVPQSKPLFKKKITRIEIIKL